VLDILELSEGIVGIVLSVSHDASCGFGERRPRYLRIFGIGFER
jgi:hypothetical protein